MKPATASQPKASPTQASAPVKTANPSQPGDIGDPSVMESGAVAAALAVDVENGLRAEEGARRLVQNGPNKLRVAPRVPAWRRALAQFQDPLIYLLLAAVAVQRRCPRRRIPGYSGGGRARQGLRLQRLERHAGTRWHAAGHRRPSSSATSRPFWRSPR